MRLSDDACPSDERALFEAWRGQGLDREVAFERALRPWTDLDRLSTVLTLEALLPPDPPARSHYFKAKLSVRPSLVDGHIGVARLGPILAVQTIASVR